MQCPNCQAELREGAAFCGSCGASVPTPEQPAAAAPAPAPVPTPVPAPVAAPADPAPVQAPAPIAPPAPVAPVAPEVPVPAPVAPTAVMPPVQPPVPPQQPGYDPAAYAGQYAAPVVPQQPAKKSKTGCIIAVVVAIILGLIGCAVAGVLIFRAASDAGVIESGDVVVPGLEEPDEGDQTAAGYATAEEAVVAELEAAGYGDWVYQLYDESEDAATYWAGPPASEWVSEIVVALGADGTWSVESAGAIEQQGGDVSIVDEAAYVVDEHLRAVDEDRGLDAQSYTVDPFRSDSASAQVSSGGLDSYEITGATEQSDMTVWVQTVQVWYGESQNWEYYVVPTEEGYRISDVRPY